MDIFIFVDIYDVSMIANQSGLHLLLGRNYKMAELFLDLISDRTSFKIGVWLTQILTILVIVMFIMKRNRDERGWKILGKASIVSFAWLLLIINGIANMDEDLFASDLGYYEYANTLQWIYNSTIIVEILSVLIITRRE